MPPHNQTFGSAWKDGGHGPDLTVAGLFLLTLLLGLFGILGNRRVVDLTPRLQARLLLDSGENRGNSAGSALRTDSSWVFHYRLAPGFAFPFSGIVLELDSAALPQGLNFEPFERLEFLSRFKHRGDAFVRIWAYSRRAGSNGDASAPNESLVKLTGDWTEQSVRWSAFRLPNWWVVQNSLSAQEQVPRFDRVHKIAFVSPELNDSRDSGTLEIARIRLVGEWVRPERLILSMLLLWVGWAATFLVSRLRAWMDQARRETDRADQATQAAEAKSQFLATMSHEIRTPLNGLTVPAQLLLQTALDDEQKGHVQTIVDSSQHLMAVVQDALDFAKIEAGRIELERIPFSIPQAFDAVRGLFEPQARAKGVTLDTAIDPALPQVVMGDPLRLRQVLMNLVSNAMKFTAEGGVSLAAVALLDGRMEIRVRDTGIGIDATGLERLFRRYSQAERSTSRNFGGTGLGLSIAQGLVQAMGGRIEVASVPGHGSTFSFSIRVEEGTLEDDVCLPESPVDLVGRRILVVDDDRVNRKVARALLEKAGCLASVAEDGSQALERLREGEYNLLLLDLHMPGLDGFEVAKAIRSPGQDGAANAERAGIPIVAMTADALQDVRRRCLEAGMNGVVTKPFRQEQLLAEIARCIRPD
jgi:signal transduction histidine kinase